MNKTRHGHTNFLALRKLMEDIFPNTTQHTHKRLEVSGYMPLVLEYLHYEDHAGRPVYSLAHYGRQNGDPMRDPELVFSVDWKEGRIEPHSFQNDYMHIFQEVYRRDDEGRLLYSKRLRADLDEFLWQWIRNLMAQGFIAQ